MPGEQHRRVFAFVLRLIASNGSERSSATVVRHSALGTFDRRFAQVDHAQASFGQVTPSRSQCSGYPAQPAIPFPASGICARVFRCAPF